MYGQHRGYFMRNIIGYKPKLKPLDNPLLSIILPCYNEEDVLQNCLDCIKKQTYLKYEIIIIDDGSADSSAEIIKNFINNNKIIRIKLLKGQHQGPGTARNIGASQAKGKILVFIDADVHIKEDYLEGITKLIRDGKTHGTMYGYEENINYSENLWARCYGKVRWNAYNERQRTYPVYSAILKSEFDRVGGFDIDRGYGEDHTIFYKLGIPATMVPVASYHKNPNSISKSFIDFLWYGRGIPQRMLDAGDPSLRKKIRIFIALLPFIIIFFVLAIKFLGGGMTSLLFIAAFLLYLFSLGCIKAYNEKCIWLVCVYPFFVLLQYIANVIGSIHFLITLNHSK